MAFGSSGFHPSQHATQFLSSGGGSLGGGGGFLSSLAGGLSNLGDFFGGQGGQGLLSLGGSLANLYGMNKAFDIADSQLDILQDQENRAATAQNLATQNSQSLALQMTTPGTPEHEAVKAAIAQGTFQV